MSPFGPVRDQLVARHLQASVLGMAGSSMAEQNETLHQRLLGEMGGDGGLVVGRQHLPSPHLTPLLCRVEH